MPAPRNATAFSTLKPVVLNPNRERPTRHGDAEYQRLTPEQPEREDDVLGHGIPTFERVTVVTGTGWHTIGTWN